MKNRASLLVLGLLLLALIMPESPGCDCSALCCQQSCSAETRLVAELSGEEFCGGSAPSARNPEQCCDQCPGHSVER